MGKKDIVKYQFTSENQPPNRGRKKGSRNLSTIAKAFLGSPIFTFGGKTPDPKKKKKPKPEPEVSITVEESIILALIKKAQSGDVAAIKEIQDTLYGKISKK